MEQRYLSIQDTATFLGVSKWTIYRLVKDQSIPYVQVRGRIVFDKEDLIGWMDKHKIPVKAAA